MNFTRAVFPPQKSLNPTRGQKHYSTLSFLSHSLDELNIWGIHKEEEEEG